MKRNWGRHILRPKHQNNGQGNEMETKKLKKTYYCDYGRLFNTNSGLWKHKKLCNNEDIKKNVFILSLSCVIIL